MKTQTTCTKFPSSIAPPNRSIRERIVVSNRKFRQADRAALARQEQIAELTPPNRDERRAIVEVRESTRWLVTLPATFIVITCTFIAGCNKTTDSGPLTPAIEKQVKTEVTALITEVNDAANNLDTDKFLSHFAPNGIFAFNGTVGEGRESILGPHQRTGDKAKPKPNGWAKINPPIETESEPPKITVVTPKAAVLTFARKSNIKMIDGETRILRAAFTCLVIKEDGTTWKIVQGHESTISN